MIQLPGEFDKGALVLASFCIHHQIILEALARRLQQPKIKGHLHLVK